MIVPPSDGFVIAEMITHDHIWQGAGRTCDEARQALLTAWHRHRQGVLRALPAMAARLPEPEEMQRHFPIRYRAYALGGGYRDDERLA